MYFFDAHCDTMLKFRKGEPCDFSFNDAFSHGGFFQVFAYFSEEDENDDSLALQTLRDFTSYIKKLETAEVIYTSTQAKKVLQQGKTAVMLALENCSCLGEDVENLYKFYNMGIRSITLTWNGSNAFAHGCMCPEGGLTKKGVDLISLAEKLGVLIDLSHLNRRSFYDVLNLEKGKVYASHSSSYAITPHPRNLTDGQIRALYKRGGVVCACPNPPFITGGKRADFTDFSAHLRHISTLTDGLGAGIGTDTDGTQNYCNNLRTTADLLKFPLLLKAHGWENYEIQNIFSFNLGRFLNIFPKK